MNKLLLTDDASPTLFSSQYNQIYHSTHGALSESMHIFMLNGIEKLKHLPEINVFEMGFGTGLNAVLALKFSKIHQIPMYYETVEKHPLDSTTIFEYQKHLPLYTEEFKSIHGAKWNETTCLTDIFKFKKLECSLENHVLDPLFHVIFFDAFSPNSQPELWTEEIFRNMYQGLIPNGFLVTYCAKGIVKRTLKQAGFEVHTLPGPPGKREMVMGLKK